MTSGVKIERVNGRLTINIEGKNYLPYAFKTFRATDRNISDFYSVGIRLFNVLIGGIDSAIGVPYSLFGDSWLDDEVYDFDVIDRQMDLFVKNAPDGYFSVMLQLDTRDWWHEKYKDYPKSFTHMAQMEADARWRDLASKYMQSAIKHIEDKYGDRVFGYFLLCGTTTEWFSDYSREVPNALVEGEYKKYLNDDKAVVPTEDVRQTDKDVIFIDGDSNKNLIDYRKFESWQRSDTIEFFIKKAQDILNHKKLMGLYFGYIFELGAPRLWETGSLDYERIILSDDVDMISSPMSYSFRAQDSPSERMITNSSLDLHNKIYFIEHDQTTCILPDVIEGKRFVHPNKAKTIEEDINLLRRDYLLAFGSGIAMWWFDMLEGWWYHPRFMDEIKNMLDISNKLYGVEYKSVCEIAVIADPESMYYVNKNCGLNEMVLGHQRMDLAYMGAPYDMYSAGDLKNIDIDRYKMFVFLDSFKKDESLVAFVDDLKKNNKTLVFSYACNVIKNKLDLDSMSDLLTFKVSANEVKEDTIVIDGKEFDCAKSVKCFKVDDDITDIGYYKNSKALAVGYKQDGYTIVFSGVPMIKEPVLRKAIELSGVHSYVDNSDNIVYVNNIGIGLYHRNENDAKIKVTKDGVYLDMFEGVEYTSIDGVLNVPYDNVRAKLLIFKNLL